MRRTGLPLIEPLHLRVAAGQHPAAREGLPAPADRAARRDQARRAELRLLASMARGARDLVADGWVQHAWFRYLDRDQRTRTASAHDLHEMAGRPVVGGCLVASLVHAGGGVAAAHTQPVQRSLDLTWHTLFQPREPTIDWCPAPAVRTAHVRDLTRWNDATDRTRLEVVALLYAVESSARAAAR